MALPLWQCDACGHRMRAGCVAGDDWYGGELVGIGPDCPVCEAAGSEVLMDPVPGEDAPPPDAPIERIRADLARWGVDTADARRRVIEAVHRAKPNPPPEAAPDDRR